MNRCYHCGEYEVVWVEHPGTVHADENTHAYCRNCDNGICEEC